MLGCNQPWMWWNGGPCTNKVFPLWLPCFLNSNRGSWIRHAPISEGATDIYIAKISIFLAQNRYFGTVRYFNGISKASLMTFDDIANSLSCSDVDSYSGPNQTAGESKNHDSKKLLFGVSMIVSKDRSRKAQCYARYEEVCCGIGRYMVCTCKACEVVHQTSRRL